MVQMNDPPKKCKIAPKREDPTKNGRTLCSVEKQKFANIQFPFRMCPPLLTLEICWHVFNGVLYLLTLLSCKQMYVFEKGQNLVIPTHLADDLDF